MGNQGEKALKSLPPFQFLLECGYKFGTIYPEAWRRTRDGVPYTPCLLMKPVLCLRLHAMQLQSCFPVASNALALPRRQRHFYGNADRAYNTLHFARKGDTPHLHGAHIAFSCYPALRLYLSSKSTRGCGVVSLILGNSDATPGGGRFPVFFCLLSPSPYIRRFRRGAIAIMA